MLTKVFTLIALIEKGYGSNVLCLCDSFEFYPFPFFIGVCIFVVKPDDFKCASPSSITIIRNRLDVGIEWSCWQK